MDFDPVEYLKLATHLRSRPPDAINAEACLRSAVSRAYYATICYARNYAEDNSENFKTSPDTFHRDIRKWYRMQGKADVVDLLRDLQKWRNQCDYERASLPNLNRRAKAAIESAEEAIEKCGQRII